MSVGYQLAKFFDIKIFASKSKRHRILPVGFALNL